MRGTSIPEDETLRTVERPAYLQPITLYAAYTPPGILEEAQGGIVLITPVHPNAPEEEKEQRLQGPCVKPDGPVQGSHIVEMHNRFSCKHRCPHRWKAAARVISCS